MKKTLFILCLLSSVIMHAQNSNPIVVQSGNNLRYASSLDSALIIAVNGDYIYLPAGNFMLSRAIDKKVFIYGVGYREEGTAGIASTRIMGDVSLTSTSGGQLNGISFNNLVVNGSMGNANSFIIANCRMINCTNNGGWSMNITIRESILTSIANPYNVGAFFVNNCIIENNISSYNIYVWNSVFLNGNNGAAISLNNGRVTSNIIFSNAANGFSNTPVSENLVVGTSNFNVDTVSNRNIYRPITYRDSVFVSHSGIAYRESSDFHTKSNCSVCENKGIYFGGYPFKNYPSNPRVVEKNVSNTTSNNYLKFQFKIRTSGN